MKKRIMGIVGGEVNEGGGVVGPSVEEKSVNETSAVEKPVQEAVSPTAPEERKYTREEVDGIVKESLSAVYGKYGVGSAEELERKFSDGEKALGEIRASLAESEKRLAESEKRLAFAVNRIDPGREDDVETWFKGKGKVLDGPGLVEALKTHPEWQGRLSTVSVGNAADDGRAPQGLSEKSRENELAASLGYDRLVG